MLKPYDVAAGIVILEEAGGRVTTADGSAYSVFDRSLLATNDALYEKVGANGGKCGVLGIQMWVGTSRVSACVWEGFGNVGTGVRVKM
jgi:hypothetical protein